MAVTLLLGQKLALQLGIDRHILLHAIHNVQRIVVGQHAVEGAAIGQAGWLRKALLQLPHILRGDGDQAASVHAEDAVLAYHVVARDHCGAQEGVVLALAHHHRGAGLQLQGLMLLLAVELSHVAQHIVVLGSHALGHNVELEGRDPPGKTGRLLARGFDFLQHIGLVQGYVLLGSGFGGGGGGSIALNAAAALRADGASVQGGLLALRLLGEALRCVLRALVLLLAILALARRLVVAEATEKEWI